MSSSSSSSLLTVPGGNHSSGKRKIIVAMDGSNTSEVAFEVASQLRGGNFLQVLHITDPQQEHLPPHLHPDFLATDFEARCSRKNIPSKAYEVKIEERREGRSMRGALIHSILEHKPDVLVLGSFGRKGPSIFSEEGDGTDWSARCFPTTTVIANSKTVVIDERPRIGGEMPPPSPPPAVFLVAVDGSTLAQQACETALFLMKPQDKLLLLHIRIEGGAGEDEAGEIKSYYEKRVEESAVNGRVVVEEKLGGTSISQQLCAAVEQAGASFLVLGTDGMGAKMRNEHQLGSVSDACCRQAACSIILVKPPSTDEGTRLH